MATYTKLRSGEWGVRIQGSATPGAVITVTTKAGKTKTETVEKVIWRGNGVTLATIKKSQSYSGSSGGSSGHKGYRQYECEECGEYVYPGSSCWETGCVH